MPTGYVSQAALDRLMIGGDIAHTLDRCAGGKAATRMAGDVKQVGLRDLLAGLPAVVMDARLILRAVRTGLLSTPGSKTSIATVFQDRAARHDDRTFLRFEGREISYRLANRTANRFAAVLAARGVRPGDVVGIMQRNSPEAVLTMLAAVKCGRWRAWSATTSGPRCWPTAWVYCRRACWSWGDLLDSVADSGADLSGTGCSPSGTHRTG